MYDFSFSSQSLSRELVASDFASMPALIDPEFKKQILAVAERDAEAGFQHLLLDHSRVRSRDLYQYGTLSKELTLRKLSRNIRMLTRVRQSNRDEIVRSLISLLREGEDFFVFKIDIKNFYPSIDREYIDQRLRADSRFPPSSLAVWQSFSQSIAAQGISGLPPGLNLSATLAEYSMREFDRQAAGLPGVYFFARYVDDMIILATGHDYLPTFLSALARHLPPGLFLNAKKSKAIKIERKTNATAALIEGQFDFLGYAISISEKYRVDQRFVRRVSIDVADKKISKLKTRLSLSLLEYINTSNFDDLEDRVRLITGNYHIYDYQKSFRRNVGIFYNYSQITESPAPGLVELDSFWKRILLSRTGNICGRLFPLLTGKQRRRLLKYSFQRSFEKRTHYHFNAERLADLIECWKYE